MELMVFSILLFIIIAIHELGHYISCKVFGGKVEELSVGLGTKLIEWKLSETVFYIRILPIGGYVKYNRDSYDSLMLYQKIIIILSGVGMNFISFIMSFGIFNSIGFLTGIQLGIKTFYRFTYSLFVEILPNIEVEHLIGRKCLPEIEFYYIDTAFRNNLIYYFTKLTLLIFCINLIPFPISDGGKLFVEIIKSLSIKTKSSIK